MRKRPKRPRWWMAASLLVTAAVLVGVAPATAGGNKVSGTLPSFGDVTEGAFSPDGAWIVEPVINEEQLIVVVLDHRRVREERQNFDPVGHYSRPDVTRLVVNRERQSTIRTED